MTTKVRKARARKQVKQALRKVEPELVKEITAEAVVKAEERVEEGRHPGQTINAQKVAWTYKDMEERFETVELYSEENVRFTINGLAYQLLQGATHYIPEPVKTAYMLRRANQRTSGMHLAEDTGFVTMVHPGAGPLEPEE